MSTDEAIVAALGFLKGSVFNAPLVVRAVRTAGRHVSVSFAHPRTDVIQRDGRKSTVRVAQVVFSGSRILLEPAAAFMDVGATSSDSDTALRRVAVAACSQILKRWPRQAEFELSISREESRYSVTLWRIPYVPDGFARMEASLDESAVVISLQSRR